MLRTVLCREGVYYFAVIFLIFFGALLRQVNLLLLFGSLLICPVYIAWRLERKTMKNLSLLRHAPKTVLAGDPFHVGLEIKNERQRLSSWAIVLEDTVQRLPTTKDPESTTPFVPSVYFEYIKAGTSRKKTYSALLPQRGKYHLGPIILSTRFPVGFFRTTLRVALEDELLVLPRFGVLSASWLSQQHQTEDQMQQARLFRASRTTGEFLSVRHWQQGDAKKWIHWRASAKHRHLVVRQCEQHQSQDVAVILDLSQPSQPSQPSQTTGADRAAIELAVSFTATLIREIGRVGSAHLLLGTATKEELLTIETSSTTGKPNVKMGYVLQRGLVNPVLLENMFKRLAIVEPTPEPMLEELFLEVLQHTSPNTKLFVISSHPVDFSDPDRFGRLHRDPRWKNVLHRLQIIDTSNPELNDYFRVEV
ncbi:MAG: DUF58 domain-containing protein [Thermoguttaceae bacterium]